jgi:tripartite-type tricarboxylate transporter receptor subunit TctC
VNLIPRVLKGLLAAATVSAAAASHAYPDKPIKLIIPFAPGGSGDVIGRVIGDELRKILNTTIVVENRPGGNGLVGAGQIAKSPPDGYTIGYSTNTVHTGGFSAFKTMPFHPINDFEPIALTASAPLILAVNVDHPAKTLKEFVDWAKKNPTAASYTHHNGGSHIAGSTFMRLLGVDGLSVPYTSPVAASADLVGGRAAFGFFEPVTIKSLLDGNRLRALGVSADKRLALLPAVPTFKEAGAPKFIQRSWAGFFAPAGTPKTIVDKLSESIRTALSSPQIVERFGAMGTAVDFVPASEFKKFLLTDTEVWKARYRDAGIEPQ